MQTRLVRVTDAGTEACTCRLEGDELVLELQLLGRAPYTTRKAFGGDASQPYAPSAQWQYPLLVERKLGEGFVCFGDGGTANLYDLLFRADAGSGTFDLHPASHTIVYATLRSEAYGADIHVLDLRSGRARTVHGVDHDHANPRQTWIRDVRYHPDGAAIYYTLNGGSFKLDLAPARRRVVGRTGGKLVARNQAQFLFGDDRGEAHIDMDPGRRFLLAWDSSIVRVLATDGDRMLFEQRVWGPAFAPLTTAAISRSGRLVAIADERHTVCVFDVATRTQVDRMNLDRDVRRIGFTPDEKQLLVAHGWMHEGPYLHAIGKRGAGFHFTDETGAPRSTPSWTFSPDGQQLVLAGRALGIHAAGTWQQLHRMPGPAQRAVFASDGRLLVTAGRDTQVHKTTRGPIDWHAPPVTPAPIDAPELRGFDAAALLRAWDGMHATGQFPCGEGYFGDKFDHWDARLEVFAAYDTPEPRYLVVFQVIGEDHGADAIGNSIFVIGDRVDWPELDMQGFARISWPQQTRITQDYSRSDERAREDDANYVSEPQDPDGDWSRLQKFRVCLDDVEYTLEPSFDDYVRTGIELSERQYRANLTAARTTIAKLATRLLHDKMWVADPRQFVHEGASFTRIYVEQGVDVVEHVSRRGPPGGFPRWRAIARLLADGARSERRVDVDAVEAAVRREYFPDKPGDEPLTAAECARVVSVTLHDDLRAADLSFLARLPSVRLLLLFRTQVSELGPLSRLPLLEQLNLAGCPVADLSPLAACRNLRSLTLSHTRVHDLGPLAGLTNLQSLDLEGTGVRDLGPLRAHHGLRELFLDHTDVEDLAPLRGLQLVRLFMRDTPVTDVSPLADMHSLAVLTLPTTVTEIDGLQKLRIHAQLRQQHRAGSGPMASKYVG